MSSNMSYQQEQNPGGETPTKNPGMEVMAGQSENEVESALRMEDGEQPRSNAFPSFSRPSSVYLLTLDEFHNTLRGSGRNYGSINMDEFLQSIWTAEENQVQAQNAAITVPAVPHMTIVNNINPQNPSFESSNGRGSTARNLSLTGQGSLSVPAPLSQRTVEEVLSEINRTEQNTNNITHAGSKQSGPTYGEMTLEDFLVRAGVVPEESARPSQPPSAFPPSPPPPPQLPQLQPQPQSQLLYGMFVNCDTALASSFMTVGCGGAGSENVPPPFNTVTQIGGLNVSDNGCGTESFEQMSHVSSNGIGMSTPRSKLNGLVERVIEKRQKRMMKNRESAARSRAKKHAYTIELEAEIKYMKNENFNLRQELAESFTRSTQQNTDAAKPKDQAKGKDKLGLLRRCPSSPF
ncbi:protein ABSCISIC ACID-INSENSITIVE 5 isoform X1 [Daucus carota subsp. sativus]|uniref:protein ABSCISIC ACID-INSENSITIVE 5 isoform X1 n=1 Tax=Daucus carota subsp. sativus TaxID=79200 RepID=UPI0007EF7251|nr:PREDICTED: protein ABSCISIC ACID-INSENSITIVE 5-like isoform X2 [Daucus carota subsp. sativus]